MRVVHVYKTYPPVLGGIEGHVALLSRLQARRGLDVTVLVTTRGPTRDSFEDGVRVLRCRTLLELRSMPMSVELARRVTRLRADVIHLHVPYPFGELACRLLARGPARPRATVATYHSDVVRQRWLGRLYRPFLVGLLRRCDRVLPTSPPYARSSPVLRRVGDRCTTVPLGVDLGAWTAAEPELAEVRRACPEPFVLFAGRLRAYKGLPHLIRAVGRLPDVRLVVAGDGPERRPAEALARQEAPARVRFLGDVSQPRLAALCATAEVVVLPSDRRSEAFGLVLAEAMACGTPVLSTELGTGTSWVNVDGETGRVVPPADPSALASVLGEVLGDPQRRRAMGERARARARREFDADLMADRVVEIYREVLR